MLTNLCGHFKICIFVDIHVANSLSMPRTGISLLCLNALNHLTGASKDDYIHVFIQLIKMIYLFSSTDLTVRITFTQSVYKDYRTDTGVIGSQSSITDLWHGFYEKWSPVRRERRFGKGRRQTFPIQRSSYHRASFIREISTWVWKEIRNCLHLGLIYCALSLVQKTRTTSSTNQIQNYNQRRDGHSAVCFFYLSRHWLLVITWVLFLRHPIEKRSERTSGTGYPLCLFMFWKAKELRSSSLSNYWEHQRHTET